MKTRTFVVSVKIEVTDNWIQDGFNPDTVAWRESIAQAIENLMPYADDDEFKVTIESVRQPIWTLGELDELGLLTR